MDPVRQSASRSVRLARRHRLCCRLGRCAGLLILFTIGGHAALCPVCGVHTPRGWIDAERWRVPDLTKPRVANNGWDLYQRAALEVEAAARTVAPPGDPPARKGQRDAVLGPWTAAIDEARMGIRPAADATPILEASAAALELVHRAATAPCVSPSLPGAGPPPGQKAFPVLARLEAARVRYLHSQGRSTQALSAARDAYAMAINVPRHGSLDDFFVGNTCIAIIHPLARRVLGSGGLAAGDCLHHARAIRALRTRKWPLGRAIQFEFHTCVAVASDLCGNGPETAAAPAGARGAAGTLAGRPLPSPVRLLAWDPEESVRWLEDRLGRLVHAARPPYSSRSWARLCERTRQDLAARGDWFASAVLPPVESARETDLAARARLAIEETAAYLAAFRAEYGHYPAALARLAPELTDALPDDPYTDEPLHYERTADGYRLWSPGLDQYEAAKAAERSRP